MDDTSFDLLCKGLSAEEARLFRKILKEWANGEEDSFPVQLALLTKVQWRAAAEMPLTLQKIIAELEAKLADRQKQMSALMITLGKAGDDKIRVFEEAAATHTEAMENVAAKSCGHLDETEKFARQIRERMEYGLRESDRITKAFVDERHRLEEARQRYEQDMEWRAVFQRFMWLILFAVAGGLFGYFAHR
jgi:hypothetical protein